MRQVTGQDHQIALDMPGRQARSVGTVGTTTDAAACSMRGIGQDILVGRRRVGGRLHITIPSQSGQGAIRPNQFAECCLRQAPRSTEK